MLTPQLKKRLDDARVPGFAYQDCTLDTLGHPFLKAVLADGGFKADGLLKSFAIRDFAKPDGKRVVQAVGRFAADLCVSVQQVVYFTRQVSVLRELSAPDRDQENRRCECISRQGKGFIVVPDINTESLAEQAMLAEFFLEHVRMGGGLVLGFATTDKRNPGLGDEFDLFLASPNVITYDISKRIVSSRSTND